MKVIAGQQALPNGVYSYHVLPTLTFVDARGDKKYASGFSYALTVSWLIWGATICYGE